MPKQKRKDERREDALSHDRIVDAAIKLLDDEGEEGLTFRALAARLETGAGAIYWHVANKEELLVAASDAVVARAMSSVISRGSPKKIIRSIAVTVFEALDAHHWVGAQLSRNPWPNAMMQIFERIGQQVQALGAAERARFTAATVLASYIIGESRQNAANGRLAAKMPDRADFLEAVASKWKALDADAYPFTRNVATQLQEHDDRAELLAGIDLILAGIAAS